MKKLIVGVSLLMGMCFLSSSRAQAASGVRGAKTSLAVNYTTTISTVALQTPAVLYSVILGTGIAGTDYVALFDTGAVAIPTIAANTTATAANLKMRLYFVGLASQTVVNFDPPIQFNNGIVAGLLSSGNAALFVFEKGRVTQGY